jgi:hypothetical protein
VYDEDDSEIYKELENDAKNSNICLLTAKKYDFEEINKFFAGQPTNRYILNNIAFIQNR